MAEPLHPHQQLLNQFVSEFGEIFTQSPQGVYAYLDDPHWVCNERFAALLGYGSATELHAVAERSSFLEACVVPASQPQVVQAYQNAVERKLGTHLTISVVKKGGGTARLDMILVPVSFQGNLLALHFLTPA